MLLLKGRRSRVKCLAFSPNGSLLALGAGKGRCVSLWDGTGPRGRAVPDTAEQRAWVLQFRELVRLTGKDGTKKPIDSL